MLLSIEPVTTKNERAGHMWTRDSKNTHQMELTGDLEFTVELSGRLPRNGHESTLQIRTRIHH